MSNIEPTEEQRAAAIRLWSRAGPTGHGMAAAVDEIARLLAEREAKLHREYGAAFSAEVNEVHILRARVAELEAVFAAATNARVADTMVNLEREAQHLADIKAAKDALERARASVEGWAIRSNDDTDSMHNEDQEALDEIDEVLARLAHYDDAKADAPAVDWQAWANGSCPEPGCSLANPHEQGAACVKPTAEGGEG